MDADGPRQRLRRLCLALPEAEEVVAWGDPTWRVRGRIFAMEKRGDGRISVWTKAPPGAQEVLIGADPATFFVPPYVGSRGWIGLRLDGQAGPGRAERHPVDWESVAHHVRESYRLVAPRRLAAMLGA